MNITYREMNALFIRFLKENNALNGFKKSVMEQKHKHFKTLENYINPLTIEPIKRLFEESSRYINIIDLAFTWDRTKEGYAYWSDLNHKWAKMILEKNITQITNEKIYDSI